MIRAWIAVAALLAVLSCAPPWREGEKRMWRQADRFADAGAWKDAHRIHRDLLNLHPESRTLRLQAAESAEQAGEDPALVLALVIAGDGEPAAYGLNAAAFREARDASSRPAASFQTRWALASVAALMLLAYWRFFRDVRRVWLRPLLLAVTAASLAGAILVTPAAERERVAVRTEGGARTADGKIPVPRGAGGPVLEENPETLKVRLADGPRLLSKEDVLYLWKSEDPPRTQGKR